ncbi:MAG: M1 family aminopeptidase [Candidatus Binatia bacterium]
MVAPERMSVRGVLRFCQRVVSVLAAGVLVCLVALSCGAYLAVSGTSVPLLRMMAAKVGMLMTGQRTEHVTLDVRVRPDAGQLAGTATLTVRSLEDGRQRFYFLLNDGLHLCSVQVGTGGAPRPAAAYQLWFLTVVDLGTPVAKDERVQLTFEYGGTPDTARFGIASGAVRPQSVLLNVDSFWYPTDVQGFFTADVTVTLPNGMTLVQNGSPLTSAPRGTEQQAHWSSSRPVAALALIAGAYDLTALDADGITYRVYLPPDVQLDAGRILTLMRDADHTLSARYGASGFTQLTLFVRRDLRRGFNDGAGTMGLPLRSFRAGDYGFGAIAHEIGHDWWGDTVGAQWLAPGSGSEWIAEGFAELSSLVATEAEYGPEALTRRLGGELFDPAQPGVVGSMSVLDNALGDAAARDTMYRKGAYVAAMLRRVLGDDVYFRGLRQFLSRYRFQAATDRDLQGVLQEVSGQKLDRYFDDWVRSDHPADLSIDGTNQGAVTISNLGSASIAGDLDLWSYKKSGGDAARSTVHVGDRIPMDADTDYMVLDPQLAWADGLRENNRYPRRNDPIHVTASARGALAVTYGAAYPWGRASIVTVDANGRTQHTWELTRGVLAPPMWSADGSHVIVSYAETPAAPPLIVSLAADGTRRTIGDGTSPAPATDGSIYAAKRDCIVRYGGDGGRPSVVTRRRGASLDQPLPSPDGARVAYSAADDSHLDVRVVDRDGGNDRFVASWDHGWDHGWDHDWARDRIVYRWSADGTRLLVSAGGSWDWQIWDVPLDAGPARIVASAAAAIGDLAVSPAGRQLAFTAAPALDYPTNRRQLYIMSLSDQTVRNVNLPNADLSEVAWVDNDALVVLATPTDQPWTMPATRTIKRIHASDGSVQDLQ